MFNFGVTNFTNDSFDICDRFLRNSNELNNFIAFKQIKLHIILDISFG